jgi:hypothetical protein
MLRTKLGLAMFAVFAFSAIAAAPASATPEWWVEGGLISEPEALASETKVAKTVIIKAPKFTVHCSEVDVKKGVIRPENINDSEGFLFTACKIPAEPKCVVANIQTTPLDFPLGGGGGNVSLAFKPKKGNEMAKLVISACGLAGTYTLTILEIDLPCDYVDVGKEATSHSLAFSEEEILIDGNKATFSAEFSWSLASGKKFSAF